MNAKNICAIVLGIVFLVIFIMVVVFHAPSWPAAAPAITGAGAAIWKDRTYDTILQGVIILAGVMSILLLLGKKQSGRMPP